MTDEIAVAHFQLGLQVRKRPAHAGRQERHNGEPATLMNHAVDAVEIEFHGTGGKVFRDERAAFGGVKFASAARPGAGGVDRGGTIRKSLP